MITNCSFIPTPPRYGIYGVERGALIDIMIDSSDCQVPDGTLLDYSELSLNYDIVRYERGQIKPVVIHLKQLIGNVAPIMLPLHGVRKLKILTQLPAVLILYFPSLYHLELNSTGARIIDVCGTHLISLKIKDPQTHLKLISLPLSTESVFISTADRMLQTDISRSKLDYFYLPGCEFFFAPNLVKTSVYLVDRQVLVHPVLPYGRSEVAPAEPPNASQLLCRLFDIHRRYTMIYYGQFGNLHPPFEEVMKKRQQTGQQTAVQFGQVSLVKNSGKSFKIHLSNNTETLNSLSQENMSADDLLENLDNTFKMQFIDQTFTMNSTSSSHHSTSRSHKDITIDLRSLGANEMDQIIEESEP